MILGRARLSCGGRWACRVALLLVMVAPPLAAENWTLRVKSVRVGDVAATQVRAKISLDANGRLSADEGRADLAIGALRLAGTGWSVSRSADAEGNQGGALSVRLARAPRLSGSWQRDASGAVALALGDGRVRARLDADGSWSGTLRDLPLSHWREFLGDLIGWTPSALDGQLSASVTQDLIVEGRVSELAFDSSDGLRAGAGVSGDFVVRFDPVTDLTLKVHAGEVLFSPAYVQIPTQGLHLAARRSDQAWALQASQEGVFGVDAIWPDNAQQAWRFSTRIGDLEQTFERYLRSIWEAQALPAIRLSGSLDLGASGIQQEPSALELDLNATSLELASLSATELRGKLNWQADAEGRFEVAWAGLNLGQIGVGPAQLQATQQDQIWRAQQALNLALLGGTMQLGSLRLDQSAQPWRADAALQLRGIDLATLCRALGWVAMPGVLSATFPSVSMSAEQLSLTGGAQIEAFGGQIALGAVEIERPLGVAPAVSASASFAELDLGEVTSVFDFGEITGKLNGEIKDLRILGGKPVAFDARLRSADDYRGRRQISQRAVNNLSSVGGAGAGGLSRSVLRVFERFGYDAIGIGCRLSGGVCTISGLEDVNGGFLIVRGSGLPRITVMGHSRRVDWDVLVARLIAATEGAGPTID